MGLDSLVEAAKLLREQELRFRVIIGGSGSAEESLRRQILGEGLQDLVLLAGRISDEHLPLCFAAADCFVLPTRALECFGLIVLESFACGTPVIGTPVGAIPELVSKQGAGWLAADASGRAIADRMAAFLRQDLRWDRASLRRFAEPWAADRRLDQMHQLLLPATAS
jgi:glycosyltransferase involved in cell wall biosynthesis